MKAMNSLEEKILTLSLATCRAVARDRSLRLSLNRPAAVSDGHTIYIGAFPVISDRESVTEFRALRDTPALHKRYSDAAVNARFQPSGSLPRVIYEQLVQARSETLGMRALTGVAADLKDMLRKQQAVCLEQSTRQFDRASLLFFLSTVVRNEFFGISKKLQLANRLPTDNAEVIERFMTQLPNLRLLLEDQIAFCTAAADAARVFQGEVGVPAENLQKRIDQEAGRSSQSRQRGESDYKRLMRAWQSGVPRLGGHKIPRIDNFEYRIYTRQFDQLIHAHQIPSNQRHVQWRKALDLQLRQLPLNVTRAARRLQSYLFSRQKRDWCYDLEEGHIDTRRLSRLVTGNNNHMIHKQEYDAPFPDTLVSLLVDNSGSMRNKPIRLATVSAEVLCNLLERCHVKTEILGFTTADWRGGKAKDQWLKDGSPQYPGRLNALRHVVYKHADENWRMARRHLPKMLDASLLRENIDGEAIQWATDRMLRRPERRRILIVLSDGAPLDEATLQVNNDDFLDLHLRSVIKDIEHRSPIELLAIGIGHDVTGYYSRSIYLEQPLQMTETILIELFRLLRQLDGYKV